MIETRIPQPRTFMFGAAKDRRLPGVTSIRSNLSLKEMKASSKLPVTPAAGT
ncbi:hypothetical protein [Jiella marina]|uniref:hypothetical protein n=1 Tax=Jiella sp. LLJ827 TaxID=2917712 RepID=UPI0021012162|nr:hypothetical protein [Jiella sp. LLJ827]MCQ0990364.1 hypothetical protein [Jiella sp. LLJ827]